MKKVNIILLMFLLSLVGGVVVSAQPFQWKSLEGPYWVEGIDVAYGFGGPNYDWRQYLIGTKGGIENVFRWDFESPKWFGPAEFGNANKIISYKMGQNGHWAFVSRPDVEAYRTTNGGFSWLPLGFPNEFNKQFSSIEIVNWDDESPGQIVLLGCEANQSLQSAYFTANGGIDWNPLGVGLPAGINVYDIETFPDHGDYPKTAVGTNDGIWTHIPIEPYYWESSWNRAAFAGDEITALETIDLWDDGKQMAAVVGQNVKNLYLTKNGWVSLNYQVLINGNPFDKNVRDMAAVYWYGPEAPISCYVTTDEGLFLIDIDAEPMACELINIADYYAPLQYDHDFKAVDYFFKNYDQYDTAFVMATTSYNVYLIKETRDAGNNTLLSIGVEEIVKGTYYCNITSVSYPSSSGANQIYALSDKSIIKKYDGSNRSFMGFASKLEEYDNIGFSNNTETFITGSQYCIRVSGPNVVPPHIWASGDSGRSWIELPQGEIPLEASINCIEAAEDSSGAVAVGTKYGVFRLDDISYYLDNQLAENIKK